MFLTTESPELKSLSEDELKALLGGKGAGLYWMSSRNLNVPPFVVFPTSVWQSYKADPEGTMNKIRESLPALREYLTKFFGYMPLVSVRSGARVSCPGMMDTILNVGLCPANEDEWKARLGADGYVDSLQRLFAMYGSVVHGLSRQELEHGDLLQTVEYYERKAGPFPDPDGQLLGSIEAVFKSWDNERAVYYRKINNIPDEWGTAVTVQAMVFGNLDDQSCTGVMFTRSPDTGEDGIVGDFLVNAQGEDVVAGIRTPSPLIDMVEWNEAISDQLLEVAEFLEKEKGDVQDIEFTVQQGVLYILQTRNAKRTDRAAIQIALDYLSNGRPRKEVLSKISMATLSGALVPSVDPGYKEPPYAVGKAACAGVAVGVVAQSSASALKMIAEGKKVVLVTKETCPDDIEAMHKSQGVLTMEGGATSHAAVVARSMNRCCVVGLGMPLTSFPEGSEITIDGNTGRIWMHHKVKVNAGDPSLVDAFVNKVYGESVEISSALPTVKTPAWVLDLSHRLHESPGDIADDIKAALENTDHLYVSFLCCKDPALSKFYEQFFDLYEGVYSRVAGVIKSLPKPPKGKQITLLNDRAGAYVLPSHVADFAVTPASVEGLAKLIAPGTHMVLPDHSGGMDPAVYNRLCKWLSMEGIHVVVMNVPGEGPGTRFVTRTKMLLELLG